MSRFFFAVFGKGLFPFILIQIIISAFSAVLVYRLSRLLLDSYVIAVLAALLVAFSHTSVILSLIVQSDTIFFFLFLLSLTLFVDGFNKKRWIYFISSGLLCGIAILFRSLAQFWPLLLIVIIFIVVRLKPRTGEINKDADRQLIAKGLMAVAIALIIVSVWVTRNIVVHGLPIVAGASANGAAKLIGVVVEDDFKRPPAELWDKWKQEYLQKNNLTETTLRDDYKFYNWVAFKIFKERPRAFVKGYFKLLWENLNDINYTHRILFPRNKSKLIGYEYDYKNRYLNYLNFTLSMLGLIILLARRQYVALTILASVYFYFLFLLGFGRWQGSRLFFPGQIAATVLMSVTIVTLCSFLINFILKFVRRAPKNVAV